MGRGSNLLYGDRPLGSVIPGRTPPAKKGKPRSPQSVFDLPLFTRAMFASIVSSRAALPRAAKKYGLTPEQVDQWVKDASLYPDPYKIAYISALRFLYPIGTRVCLNAPMDTGQNPMSAFPLRGPEPGTEGTICGYDDSASKVDVEWDNGTKLALLFEKDDFTLLGPDGFDPS